MKGVLSEIELKKEVILLHTSEVYYSCPSATVAEAESSVKPGKSCRSEVEKAQILGVQNLHPVLPIHWFISFVGFYLICMSIF